MKKLIVLTAFIALSLSTFGNSTAFAKRGNAKHAAKVYFENIKNDQTIAPDELVKFGVKGMKVVPAGELKEGTGHHHLIIDGASIAKGEVVPADESHFHFGKGQTETKLNLKPGDHTLTLQFADGTHKSYGESLSTTIKVHVK